MLYRFNLSLVKETVLYLLWIMQNICYPHCYKNPSGGIHVAFYIQSSFLSWSLCPSIASSLPTSLPSFHICPPGMLQAHKTCPCSLLLETWFLLLSVPTSMLLFSSQLFPCSVNLKWLHWTPSLRWNYTASSIIVLLGQANGNWPHLSMGDLQVSIHQKYTTAEREMWKDVSQRKKKVCLKAKAPPSHWAIYSCRVVHRLTPGLAGWLKEPCGWRALPTGCEFT